MADGFSQDGGTRLKEIINALSGGGTPQIAKSLEEEHARKKAELEMYQNNAKTLAGILMKGADPATGKPLTPEQKQKYQSMYDSAWGAYTKGIKGNKAASAVAQKLGGILHHLTGRGGAGQGAQGKEATPAPAVPAPPQGNSRGIPEPGAAGGGGGGGGGEGSSASPAAPSAASGGAPAVPPPPSMMEQMGVSSLGEQVAARQKSEEAGATEDAKARAKAQVEMDPTLHQNALKQAYADVNEAFPNLPEEEKERLAEQSAGFIPKGGGAGSSIKGWAQDAQGNLVPMTVIGGQLVPMPASEGYTPVNIPSLPTARTSEQPGIDPETGKIGMITTHATSRKVVPRAGGKGASVPAPPGGGGSSKSGSSNRLIPMRQYNALMKPATAVDEARASLIGDDESTVGGLAADLELFDHPQSIKRVGEYLSLVNGQIEAEGKAVSGMGPMAAVEWYVNLPQTLVELQQGALRNASAGLTPAEQRFVADYYRVLGTIGGMRAATGASAARWSYNTLRSELPTPGPVTNRVEAARRLKNFVSETNVVAKRNPLLKPTDTKRLEKTVPPPPGGGRKGPIIVTPEDMKQAGAH